MDILHIIPSLATGGAQKIVCELAIQQKGLGHSVSVLVHEECFSDFEKRLKGNHIDLVSLNCSNIHSLGIIFKIRAHIEQAGIIHVHLFPSLYQCAIASLGISKKLVYTEHSTYNRRRGKKILRPFERFIYNRYSTIVSISESVENNLKNWLHLKNGNKFRVIHNGIDLSVFANHTAKKVEDLYGRDGIPVLMISRFTEAKDQETVIRAIKYINNPQVFAAFAGTGDKLEKCKGLAKSLNLSDRCVFLGNRDDVPDLIGACKLGVQSSHWEGFGLTAIELMAAGKPVIASDVPGLKQVVEGGGLLFEKGNDKQLADLIKSLSDNKEEYEKIAGRCKSQSQQYDIKFMAEKYMKVYKTLLGGG